MNHFRRLVSCLGWIVLFAAHPGKLQADGPTPTPTPVGRAKHVLIMVWDGLRPDGVTEADTPTLAKLAREGVTFTHHHPVYPSTTEVNGTAMATGCYPGHSGLIGNREYRPAIDPLQTVPTENLAIIRRGDDVSGGKYLLVPTLPELAHAAGWRTAVAGTKAVAVLWDRAARPENARPDLSSVTLAAGKTLPSGAIDAMAEANGGPFPPDGHLPNTAQDHWTVNALTRTLWKDEPPKFSVLWMSDPDFTQHKFGPSSPQAHRALAGADTNLAAVLAALDAGHWRETTDVFVVSDHGFSTIGHRFNLADQLAAAGFPAKHEFRMPPQPGDVVVNALGGTALLYVIGHGKETTQRLVDFLQRSEFAGVIFTREGLPGTFRLADLHVDSPEGPDIFVSMRWSDDKNANALPGTIHADGDRVPGQGTHGTLSRYEMHNTLIASGPDFHPGFRDELPSSNADLAPTVAYLLGLPHPPPMDGRVLTEALTGEDVLLAPPTTKRVEANRDADDIHWRQYLQTTRCGDETYFDEGNAMSVPAVVESGPATH